MAGAFFVCFQNEIARKVLFMGHVEVHNETIENIYERRSIS